jgi:hypothetical protein
VSVAVRAVHFLNGLVDERRDDLDPTKETVGSSSGPVLLLPDVRIASADDLNLFSPALEGLVDRPRQPPHVLDGLREDVEESSHHLCERRDDRDQSSDDVVKSSHYGDESSQRRFQLESARCGPTAVVERLPHDGDEGAPHVDGQLASRFRLPHVRYRLTADGFRPTHDME